MLTLIKFSRGARHLLGYINSLLPRHLKSEQNCRVTKVKINSQGTILLAFFPLSGVPSSFRSSNLLQAFGTREITDIKQS